MPTEGPWGQAVPTRSLNQKPCHLGEFRFSNPKVRPDPVVGPSSIKDGPTKAALLASTRGLYAYRTREEDEDALPTKQTQLAEVRSKTPHSPRQSGRASQWGLIGQPASAHLPAY